MMRITEKTRRNWSDLQSEILELILRRLSLADIARFKVVCSVWNAAAKSYTSGPVYKPLLPQTPWLMLPREREDNDAGRFFSLSEKKVYTFRNLFQGFSEDEKLWLGSSHGWLLIMSDSKIRKSVHLLNPISRVRITLPPLEFMVQRVFLSSDPSCSKTFIVVGVPYVKEGQWTRFAFHKHGDDGNNSTTWSYLDNNAQRGFLDNFIFHKNLLYVLCSCLNSISVWDFGGAYPIKTIDFQLPERELGGESMVSHLVESLGEILLVERVFNLQADKILYKVHKLNITTPNKVECLKVECLEERALVLSQCQSTSMSLSTLDFPELEANSIYVAQLQHVLMTGGLVLSLNGYNLESNGFKTSFTFESAQPRQLLWIVPNPCLV